MNDHEIRNSLTALPRATASPHFTRDVLRAIGRKPAQRPVWRYAAAFATACLVVVFVVHAAVVRAEHQRIEALRAEHQKIQSELQQVKAIAGGQRPVVVLENDDTRLYVNVADHQSEQQQPYTY